MLPPYDDSDYNEDGYPFDQDSYNHDVYGSYFEATEAYNEVSEYFHNTGFTNDDWFSMITVWEYDEDGGYYFEWEDENGEYRGSGHT